MTPQQPARIPLESKPPTTATTTSLHQDAKKAPAMVTKEILYSLEAGQKPYYCENKIQTPEPSCHGGSAWPCTGALCPCTAVTTNETSALA
jgi:hypothetical protein